MPPKKQSATKPPETPKKAKGGIAKRTPSKATPTKRGESTAERDLMFLWKAGRLSGGFTVSNTRSQSKHTYNSHHAN